MGGRIEIVDVVSVWQRYSLRMHLDWRRRARVQWDLRIDQRQICLLIQLRLLLKNDVARIEDSFARVQVHDVEWPRWVRCSCSLLIDGVHRLGLVEVARVGMPHILIFILVLRRVVRGLERVVPAAAHANVVEDRGELLN